MLRRSFVGIIKIKKGYHNTELHLIESKHRDTLLWSRSLLKADRETGRRSAPRAQQSINRLVNLTSAPARHNLAYRCLRIGSNNIADKAPEYWLEDVAMALSCLIALKLSLGDTTTEAIDSIKASYLELVAKQ